MYVLIFSRAETLEMRYRVYTFMGIWREVTHTSGPVYFHRGKLVFGRKKEREEAKFNE